MRSPSSKFILRISVLLFLLLSSHGSGMDAGEQQASHQSSHSEHHHHVAALIAATSNLVKKHTDFTLGGDYHYRFAARWAVGGFGEAVFAEHTEYLLGVPVYFFPSDSFWLRAGPGVEFEKTGEDSHGRSSSGGEPPRTEAKFLFRFGVGYNFEMSGLTITPSLDVDLVRSADALVWGLSIGKSF